MTQTKEKSSNQVETPDGKVKTPTRLGSLLDKYPGLKDDFHQFFRDNGMSDWIFYNLYTGRQKGKPFHNRLIDRMVKTFDVKE